MKETYPLHKAQQAIMSAIAIAPTILSEEGLNFFLDSFTKQGWLGAGGMERWPARKKVTKWGKTPRPGRALLVDSGRLRRSVRIISKSPLQIVWGTDVPYARVHNEGFRAGVIQQVNQFSRRNKKTGKKSLVRAHTRRITQRIPQRQFMGNSPYLDKRLVRILTAEFNRALKNI